MNRQASEAGRLWLWLLVGAGVILLIVIALSNAARAQGSGTTSPAAPVPAQTFAVQMTPSDSGNINQLCLWAADSRGQLGEKSAVSQYCLDLLNRIAQGQKGAQESAKASAQSVPSGEKKGE